MAGFIPSFASGANLVIYIGAHALAYGTNLSFVDDVANAPIGGIGGYSFDTIEPTQYIARGNFSITRYSKLAIEGLQNSGFVVGTDTVLPGRMGPADTGNEGWGADGNSMLSPTHFNPINLLASRTFNIIIYERNTGGNKIEAQTITLTDCRLTSYSLAFTPGSLVAENLGFICLLADDTVASNA